jgi:hypothetical protein
MDTAEHQKAVQAGKALLAELRAHESGYPGYASFPELLSRFPDLAVRAALMAAYDIGHDDGESERDMYGVVAQLRELCDEKMVEAEGGGRTDADTIWPSAILAILDAAEKP